MTENIKSKPNLVLQRFILISTAVLWIALSPYTGTLAVISICLIAGLFALLSWNKTSQYPPKLITALTLIYVVITACVVLFTLSVLFSDLMNQLSTIRK